MVWRPSILLLASCASSAPPSEPVPSTDTAHASPAASAPTAPASKPTERAVGPAPLATYEGSLPAPERAFVVGERADGSVLVYVTGQRAATARDRARMRNTLRPAGMGLPSRASVGYHVVLDPSRRCVVDTLSMPAFDDLVAAFAQIGEPPKSVSAEARAELDRAYAWATSFGTHTLPDVPIAFGSSPARVAFETSSFVYLIDGSTIRDYNRSAAVGPRASPNGKNLVASGCNGKCGDYVMQLLPEGASRAKPGPLQRASEFWFRDDDTFFYTYDDGRGLTDPKKVCVREYSFTSKAVRNLRCFDSNTRAPALTFSPRGAFAILSLGHGVRGETKVLRPPSFEDVWSAPFSHPYTRVDDQGRLLFDANDSKDFHMRTHLVEQGKPERVWENTVTAGFVEGGKAVLTLASFGPSHEAKPDQALDAVRCTAFLPEPIQ